jgi:poly(hydroxyalkanoate) depolymerase family esterase
MEAASTAANSNPRLDEMTGFGSNPGKLVAKSFIPDSGGAGMPLVVVLHGCTQNAGLYDRGSGWSELAEREGFALLYPEQQRSNNSNLCFNWYLPGDARRGGGEAASIAQMVGHMVEKHGIDPSRVYVNGLSAGGAMTSVMLATYPELFAGGAVIAGLPFASARTLPEALERMRGQGAPSTRTLASRARSAADHSGPMPTLSVWHGTQDSIVDPANADELVGQWLDLHGLAGSASEVEKVGRHRREVWRDKAGRAMVERYDISGMGHGTPLSTGGAESVGATGPHMLEAGISSTRLIAESWGLSDPVQESSVRSSKAAPAAARADPFGAHQATDMIEDALRAAGLMR